MKFFLLALLSLSSAAADAARDNAWRQDLDNLATELPQRHPNLFFQTPRAVFDQAVSDLRTAIPTLSDAEVMVGLARIAALPGDGHTNLWLMQRNALFHLLPIQLKWFDDGLFVIGATAPYRRALGAQVLRIGDRTADEAYPAVSALISHENDSWVREMSPEYLVNVDILQALGIVRDTASVRFELQELSGATFSLDIQSLDPGSAAATEAFPDPSTGHVPLYQRQRSLNYWFTYIESSRTLYFAYNLCQEMPNLPFAQFNSQFWATFDSQPVERVIIDLRNNIGGSSPILDPFVAAGFARQERFAAARPYVIIGRRTFSAAITNAITMHQGPVTIVGEPSGGSPNTYTEVLTFTLPNSKLVVSYSTKRTSYPQLPDGPLMPDVRVPLYSADYFARHDSFLAAALADALPPRRAVPSPLAVVNAATYRPAAPVAPGSLAAVFGDWGATPSADAALLPLPTQLGGLQVLVDDVPAPLVAVRPGQINFQVPADTPAGAMPIRITQNRATVASGTAQIAGVAPGLFVGDPADPARPGAAIVQGRTLQLYGTGQGATSPEVADGAAGGAASLLAPRVYIGAELAAVSYSGLQPSFPGLWQINVAIPDAVPAGQVPVFIVIGSAASNAVTVRVGN